MPLHNVNAFHLISVYSLFNNNSSSAWQCHMVEWSMNAEQDSMLKGYDNLRY
jgi:hypothetical protein